MLLYRFPSINSAFPEAAIVERLVSGWLNLTYGSLCSPNNEVVLDFLRHLVHLIEVDYSMVGTIVIVDASELLTRIAVLTEGGRYGSSTLIPFT